MSFCGCCHERMQSRAAPVWAKPWTSPVTWHVDQAPPGVTLDHMRQVAAWAFGEWCKYALLDAVEAPTTAKADVAISFAVTGAFAPGVIASTNIPVATIDLPIWIFANLSYDWTQDVFLRGVLLHEVGHTLGMDHDAIGSVMAPYYSGLTALQDADIKSITDFYGARVMPTWTKVADAETGTFTLTASTLVRYGKGTAWVEKTLPAGTYACKLSTFGTDPAYGVYKECQVSGDAPPTPPDPIPPTQHQINIVVDGKAQVYVDGVLKADTEAS